MQTSGGFGSGEGEEKEADLDWGLIETLEAKFCPEISDLLHLDSPSFLKNLQQLFTKLSSSFGHILIEGIDQEGGVKEGEEDDDDREKIIDVGEVCSVVSDPVVA